MDNSSSNATSCYFAVTKHTYSEAYTNPAFSVASSEITSLGTTNCSITTNASYTPEYIDYVFYNSAHHYFNKDNSTSMTAVPSAETISYTWNLEGADDFASINSSGVITYSSYPANDTTVTVTLTAKSTSRTVTVCQEVTFKASVAKPVISFDNMTGLVTITCGTDGASIYYTTNGNAPTASSTQYSAPFSLSEACTVKAFATKSGFNDSPVAELTINKVATPEITQSGNSVTISCDTVGATIYYTTDGSTPTTSSSTYSSALTGLAAGTVVKAIAVKSDLITSATASHTFIKKLDAPTINFNNSTNTATITASDGATIHYTTDGTTATASSPVYSAAITGITTATTISAIATKEGSYTNSDVTTKNITKVVTPTFNQDGNNVTIVSTEGATVYYTTNNTTPTTSSSSGISPLQLTSLTSGVTLRAIAIKDQMINSDESEAWLYRQQLAMPTYSFTSSNGKLVLSTISGATIHYTTDGSDPKSSATVSDYSTPISITGSTTVKFYATHADYNASVVNTATLTQVAAPTFSQTGTSLSLGCTTDGASIRYTTDGTDPTYSTGTVYSGTALTGLTSGSTIKAIAYKEGMVTSTVESYVYREQVPAPSITFTPNEPNSTASTSFSCSLDGVSFYYTVDGSTPTTSSTPYSAAFNTADGVTVKVIAVKDNYNNSQVVTKKYIACQLAAPTITITSGGVTFSSSDSGVTFRYTVDGTDPTETTGTVWGGSTITGIANGATIKAIATRDNCQTSLVASATNIGSGTSGGVVTINDLEDHSWTYYSDKPDSDYPDVLRSPDPRDVKITYKGVDLNGELSSNVAVSTTESANEFVYYKTIEKLAWGESTGRWLTGEYAYRTIPNPFSKRPKSGSTYYGFAGWKVTKGASLIGKSDGAVLSLEEIVNFTGLAEGYKPDANEVEFEATWTAATVKTGSSAQSFSGGTYETNFWVVTGSSSVTISAPSAPMTVSSLYPDGTSGGGSPTIESATSSTSSDNTLKIEYIKIGDGTTPVHPTSPSIASSTTGGSGTFTAQAGELIVGRGCTGTVNYVTSGGSGGKYVIRLESGKYTFMYPMASGSASSSNYGRIVLGCDYDRVADDGIDGNGTGDNTKLRILNYVSFNGSGAAHADNDVNEYLDLNVKSGYYGYSANYSLYSAGKSSGQDGLGLGIGGNTDNYSGSYTTIDANGVSRTYSSLNSTNSDYTFQKLMSFYVGRTRGGGAGGINRLLVEGGEFNSINGGGSKVPNETINYHFRMKGGWVKGAIYGTASISNTVGSHKIVITGGEVNGWVAGGCNGTDFSAGDGKNEGTCYIYAGGNAELRSHGRDGVYNNAYGLVFNVQGGNIYGAGRGLAPYSDSNVKYCGSTTTSYVVVGDNAYVEQNVYGGGYNGVSQTSHVYITGGTIGKKVFGGTAKAISTDATWRCNTTDIRMYGGTVEGGIYGGHDETGIQYSDASIKIYDGQIGTSSAAGGVFGGGYGSGTSVQGNVDVMIGTKNGSDDSGYTTDGTAVIWGDVYGGSALGSVNGTSANTTYHTNVTLNGGTIYGSLYGGALGDNSTAANVYAPVAVKVYGGSVIKTTADGSGGVYGANNVNGAPQNSVTVDIYGTDAASSASQYALYSVYGGGNKAGYTYGNGYPKVTVHNCDNSIEYVYGGGNAAAVAATDVTIYGGNVIGNVFGGGNGTNGAANVTGNAATKIYGGTILNVFGGSNSAGTIGGTISVKASETTESGHSACPIRVTNLYGGGNKAASAAGSIDIECATRIDTVYGGANAANITGNIDLNIKAGNIGTVFGANNTSGTVNGTISITANWDSTYSCDKSLGSVYGGGNLAPYTGSPTVNILNCTTTGSIYGGGKGSTAIVTGNTTVNIGDWVSGHSVTIGGSVFGGGDEAPLSGTTNVTIRDCNTVVVGDVYGGGNATYTNGNNLTIWGGTINRVFGGGNGIVKAADVNGNADTKIYGGTYQSVFGGSNTNGDITGTAHLLIDQSETCSESGAEKCSNFNAKEVYGAGNEASMYGSINFELLCIDKIDTLYGGAKKADIGQDINLKIVCGEFKCVFGGNNLGGTVNGSITVNVDETGCSAIKIGELYGCGNEAPYSTPSGKSQPTINLKSFTSIGKVFGGGYGAGATVTGNPVVNVGVAGTGLDEGDISHVIGSLGNIYGGGNMAAVIGTSGVNVYGCNAVIDTVYGGGNMAAVNGTNAVIWGGTITEAYGGGYKSNVNGNTSLTIHGGEIDAVYAGNNASGTVTGTMTLNIDPSDACSFKIGEVYGGGNKASGHAGEINIECCSDSLGNVYGGARAATIDGDITLNIKGGKIDNVFGGNNESGNIGGKIVVNINMADSCGGWVKNVYGGGNLAPYNAPTATPDYPEVNLINGKIGLGTAGNVTAATGYVFGGGYGSTAIVTGNPHVNLVGGTNTTCTVLADIYGGGDAAPVKGNPTVVTLKGTAVNVFGGGREADVTGKTSVQIKGDTQISGNVYGGGNQGKVIGGTTVQIGDECN